MNPEPNSEPAWLRALLPWLQWLTTSAISDFLTWRLVEFLDALSTR